MPFLQGLHASFRALEMALVPWPPAQKQAFLDDQFRLQHAHFTRFYAAANFWIVMRAAPLARSRPVGRLYLDRSGPLWRIVEIGFMPDARGCGMGSAILDWIKASAVSAGARGVALSVATNNPRARALYLRAGFVDDGVGEGFHQPMIWREMRPRP
jgi:RimJ/RimL family protein N-acetyltransferase